MATRDNLIATYQSNPTLQGRYTQQQYLDLFGFGQQGPTLPVQPDEPQPIKPEEGIKNIIGQNLNQGGGGGGGIMELQPTFSSEPRRPGVDFTSNPAAQLTGKGRLDPMGSGFYDTLNRLEASDPSRGYRMSTFNENFSPSGEVIKDTSIDFNPDTNPNIRKAFFESVYQDPKDQSFLDRAKGGLENLKNKFFTPRIRGTLGDRLQRQSERMMIPSLASMFGKLRSPFNPESPNYNPNLPGQLNYLETQDGLIGRDPGTYGLKYGPESVLSGQNVVSGFGTNDYLGQLNKYQDKVTARYDKLVDKFGEESDEATKYYDKFVQKVINEKKKFTDSAIYKAQEEQRKKEEAAAAAAAAAIAEKRRAEQYGAINYGRGADGQQSYSGDAIGAPGLGFGVGATTGGPVSNRTGRGRQDYSDGGRVYLYNRLK